MPEAGSLRVFVGCAPGLESFLDLELEELGFRQREVATSGSGFEFDVVGWTEVWRLNLWCGTATRVLVRIANFRASRLPELRRKAANIAWADWLPPAACCSVRAVCKKSKLYHSGAVAQRVGEALQEFGATVVESGDDEDSVANQAAVRVSVRVEANECTVSLDTSGEPLDRRGWRLATAKAPLRADIARALVMTSGWCREGAAEVEPFESPLVDPLCGAGTIAIEAAGLARRAAPGRARRFSFEWLPSFDADAWAGVRDGADGSQPSAPTVFASDRDSGAVAATRGNAERANVLGDIVCERAALRQAAHCRDGHAATGVVVCNPPFGKRVGKGASLRDLYAALGASIQAGWRLALVSAASSDPQLLRAIGLSFGAPRFTVQHGGIRVRGLLQHD